MAGLDPAIHVFLHRTWMPGTRPGMTKAAAAFLFGHPALAHRSFTIPN
jgi:hypothetical protein